MSLNHIIIMGRLTRDPELRRTGSGLAVASFNVAVERDFPNKDTGDKEVDFIDCVAWRQTGEFVSKYFPKGSLIVVSGRLQIRTWKDKDGNNRKTAEIVAENCYFGGSKKESQSEGNNQNNWNNPYTTPVYSGSNPWTGGYAKPDTSDFALLDDDDAVLPF